MSKAKKRITKKRNPKISTLQKRHIPRQPSINGWQLKPSNAQGPFTSSFTTLIARKFSKDFFEFLREALPLFDAAIWRMVGLDGEIIVKGKNDNLVADIKDWMDNVRVNDIQQGFMFYDQGITNEALEQGFGMGEWITNRRRDDIVALRVADSKTIDFQRDKNGLKIFQTVQGDLQAREITKIDQLTYFGFHNEAQNPYGTPLFRSCEFMGKVLATIDNSLLLAWARFGDPPYKMIYKASPREQKDLEARTTKMQEELQNAIRNKLAGETSDFVWGIGRDDEIIVEVLGAKGEKLEVKEDAKYVIGQVLAKTGLFPWMFGLSEKTDNNVADQQGALVQADSKRRQKSKLPAYNNIIANWLRLRGKSWNPKDWFLAVDQVNVIDREKEAKVHFMKFEAAVMGMQVVQNIAGLSLAIDDEGNPVLSNKAPKQIEFKKSIDGDKETRQEPWPEIDALEDEYEKLLISQWDELEIIVTQILGLAPAQKFLKRNKQDEPPAFTMSSDQEKSINQALDEFLDLLDTENLDSPLLELYSQAFTSGIRRGADLTGRARPVTDIIQSQRVFDRIASDGFGLVKNQATKGIQESIIPAMRAQVEAGSNPRHVAAELKRLFGKKNSDWVRLARTEMTVAAENGKTQEWKEEGFTTVVFVPALNTDDSLCLGFAGEHPIDSAPIPGLSTHPRCVCALRPGKQ